MAGARVDDLRLGCGGIRLWIVHYRVAYLAAVALLFVAGPAWSQVPLGVPLPTTLLLEKAAPNTTFDNKQVIEIGVKAQTYKFILKDAYVDDPNGKIFWNDVWR